ncbi:MAG: hypothetical protein GY878_30190 [Fuerstiella sp.]|nr:hypothetical protein [Fuerstiella sp.]
MRYRIPFVGVGVPATLAIALLLGGLSAAPVVTMAESVKAKSYCYDIAVRDKPGSLPPRPDTKGKAYWMAPGSVRAEMTSREWKGPEPKQVDIYPAGKPGIHIFHPRKTFWQLPIRQIDPMSVGLEKIEELGKFISRAQRQLGTMQINGKNAQGFAIDHQEIYPQAQPGTMEVWLDAETNLPVLIRSETRLSGTRTTIEEKTNIQWNIDLDAKLFDPTPPEGYTDATPRALSTEEQVAQVIEGLRIYAKLNGGQYPATSGPW